jgi:hypothetical protein
MYEWINIDQDSQAEQFVLETQQRHEERTDYLFPDGSMLVEPKFSQLVVFPLGLTA